MINNAFPCIEICGDGLLYELPCDDGNIIDGDGCSSACQIEANYGCTNGSSVSPNVCSYNGPFSVQLKTGDKDPRSNSMTLLYHFEPIDIIQSLNGGSTDITSLINFPSTSGITVREAIINPITKELMVKFDYS